jgi:hypothetical protein
MRVARGSCIRCRRDFLDVPDRGAHRVVGISERESIAPFDRLLLGLRIRRKGRRDL